MDNLDERYVSQYQMRYAAGIYWLLDMNQDGVPYRKPLATNEVGARIWELTQQGYDDEVIVEMLSAEYQAERNMISEDIKHFRLQLQQYMSFSRQNERKL